MNKKIISGIGISAIVLAVSLYFVVQSESAKITTFEECEKAWFIDKIMSYDGDNAKCSVRNGRIFIKQRAEQPVIPPVIAEPESLPLTVKGYVYDAKLNYGFEYPDGWEFAVDTDKDVEQCGPALNCETYTCVDFPDKNIKKVITFTKGLSPISSLPSPQIDFTVKLSASLQEVAGEFKKEVKASSVPILSEKAISVNNVNGYDMLAGTSDWKMRQTVFFAGGTAYVFKYSSQEKFYRMYEGIFSEIINSFKVK